MPAAAACVPNLFLLMGTSIPLFMVLMMLIALYYVANRMLKDKRYLFDSAMHKE